MSIYYSASQNGFYNDLLKNEYKVAGTWPDDVFEISERWYQYLINGQARGKVIIANEYGQPVLSNPPELTKDQVVIEAKNKKSALMLEVNDLLAPLQDAVDLGLSTSEENALLLEWKKYRILLNRVETSNAPNIEWPVKPTLRT
ncbi:tail fiber assembly protein [Enterobacter sp. AG326]|uniref:tail fiber assembly protein n=1 Tax=Enterobacter sp. AG326 TaxID=2183902 RepID=UPI00105E6BE1|nr:tail fiber assembly protein [Enterobacter sp. AG326]